MGAEPCCMLLMDLERGVAKRSTSTSQGGVEMQNARDVRDMTVSYATLLRCSVGLLIQCMPDTRTGACWVLVASFFWCCGVWLPNGVTSKKHEHTFCCLDTGHIQSGPTTVEWSRELHLHGERCLAVDDNRRDVQGGA